MSLITLLTDFGLRDPYVGILKGVIYSINPEAQLVDLTHEVTSYNILEASFFWASVVSYFEKGTVHLAVVDPGVGSKRRIMAALVKDQIFIGPDNGLFTFLHLEFGPVSGVVIDQDRFFLPKPSATFHGRDLFAPIAAKLSMGMSMAKLGGHLDTPMIIKDAQPRVEEGILLGRIIITDSFGNLITNIKESIFRRFVEDRNFIIEVAGTRFHKIHKSYFEVPPKTLLALFDSYGYLEISANQSRADRYLFPDTSPIGQQVSIIVVD